ncbi:hypothetical protein [Gordonia sp. (in: high G+C Gram-positive bacteria)]|uniref:hypothetical protein n=1 Tax=Gordonia sp. (in: high G+C Gram-positive bacteria) TaxID=84139 RepID=UPI003C74B0DE
MAYLIMIAIVIAAAYLSWRLMQSQSVENGQPRGSRPPAPKGPDDDPDFLRTLGH